MKFIIVGAILLLLIMLFIACVAAKAVNSVAVYLDDSFRWGGRDGK